MAASEIILFHDYKIRLVSPPPLPSRNYQPLHLAVQHFSPQLPGCRKGDAQPEVYLLLTKLFEERCCKFSQTNAYQIPHRRPQPGRKWHLDKMRVEIKGEVLRVVADS